MKFNILAKDKETKARAGNIETPHGMIETPIFMPVGTVGSVKGIQQKDLKEEIEAQIILGNTYHLYLRPGTELLENAGGLHKFMHWDKPILTDSGGYQVYSLAQNRKISEEGVLFQSHIDGSRHFFSPESAMDIQASIGGDIFMAFDECPPYPAEKSYVQKSMHLTHRWLKRCLNHVEKKKERYGYEQALFPIVQGGVHKDLRMESAQFISDCHCAGNAIGGLSVGEPADMMYEMTDRVTDILPVEKPRYLMGVGTPENIIENISLGIDMFDCVMPTRNGRNGMLFTTEGIINIKNKKWENDFTPIDPGMENGINTFYSKAYLRHLFAARELLALQIASMQNLKFYLWLVRQIRNEILQGTFTSWKKNKAAIYSRRL